MPVAAIVATASPRPPSFAHLTWQLLLIGLGLALLLPVIPFTLELLALRRLTTAAFGTLMSLEPAIALGIGLLVAAPDSRTRTALVGIAFVVAAGIGAQRTGARAAPPSPSGPPDSDPHLPDHVSGGHLRRPAPGSTT